MPIKGLRSTRKPKCNNAITVLLVVAATIKCNPITARYRKIRINIHDVGDYTLLQAISAAVALTDNRSCNYTVSQKGSHLIFDNNFGKCGPIFKILSPIDS